MYCSQPCVCDTQDFLKVDTLNVTLAGQQTVRMHFVVEGNPCDHPEQLDVPFVHPFNYGGGETTIRRDAPEVRCGSAGELLGATLSDHGYPIISLFFDAPGAAARPSPVDRPTPGRVTTSGGVSFQDEQEYANECAARAAAGYNSGMGEIFRKVAAVSPIVPGKRATLTLPKGLLAQKQYTEAELNAERSGFLKRVIRDYAGTCVGCQEKRDFVAKILALQAGEGRSFEDQALSGDGRVPSRAAHKGMLAQLNYTEAELSKQRVASLKRILRDYGVSCVGCNEKAEFVAKVLSVQREACAAK